MAEYPRIGTPEWKSDMQWGWGIFKQSEYLQAPWVTYNAESQEEQYFSTHRKATGYVRSEIDKG